MSVRKADLVRENIVKQMDDARSCGDEEEFERLRKELEYLDTHRSEY
ncbi:hypothetical protein [Mesorhizobium sp. M4B.F.Ca.ET.058.02.1.1]|nr:hypothetical protein [Mesorhizobium sp. M4B.F.Ca.ET.058.02.1.1]